MPWDTKLSRTLTLRDGRELETLRDGADAIARYFQGVRKHDYLEGTIEALMKAERTARRADVADATRRLVVLLQDRAVMDTRPASPAPAASPAPRKSPSPRRAAKARAKR